MRRGTSVNELPCHGSSTGFKSRATTRGELRLVSTHAHAASFRVQVLGRPPQEGELLRLLSERSWVRIPARARARVAQSGRALTPLALDHGPGRRSHRFAKSPSPAGSNPARATVGRSPRPGCGTRLLTETHRGFESRSALVRRSRRTCNGASYFAKEHRRFKSCSGSRSGLRVGAGLVRPGDRSLGHARSGLCPDSSMGERRPEEAVGPGSNPGRGHRGQRGPDCATRRLVGGRDHPVLRPLVEQRPIRPTVDREDVGSIPAEGTAPVG